MTFVQATILLSPDSMEETPKNARLFGGQQISQDLLNKVAPSGVLPDKLTLKEGAPVMLLRNMHGARGQANGTRMLTSPFTDFSFLLSYILICNPCMKTFSS